MHLNLRQRIILTRDIGLPVQNTNTSSQEWMLKLPSCFSAYRFMSPIHNNVELLLICNLLFNIHASMGVFAYCYDVVPHFFKKVQHYFAAKS